MPRLPVPWQLKQRTQTFKNPPLILDAYSFGATFAAGMVLIYFITFPSLATTAEIGLLIGIFGIVMTLVMWAWMRKLTGEVIFTVARMPVQYYLNSGIFVTGFFVMSLVLQIVILFFGGPSQFAGFTVPNGFFYELVFVQAMAIFEEWPFRAFLFRMFRSWFGNWVIALILSAGAFAVYHYSVYQGNILYEATAFIGGAIYAAMLQASGRLSYCQMAHALQNIPRG